MNLVSIIVPVYNGERYLRALLDSILAQTYSNWECICVNDSSTDSSLAILEEYAQKDSRFRVLIKPNGGTGDSRNFGLDSANGSYIMFADQDDMLHPEAMALATAGIESTGADVLQFDRCAFTTSPKWAASGDVLDKLTTIDNPLQNYLTKGNLVIYVWQYIYRKEILCNIKFPKLTGGEDCPFIFDVALATNNWVHLPIVLYGFRENLASVSRSIPAWYIDNGFTACEIIFQHGKAKGVDEVLLTKRTTRDAFMFALSIILRHGRGQRGKSNMSAVSDNICKALSIGYLAKPYLSVWQRVIVALLEKRKYALLRLAAYTLGYLVVLVRAATAAR